LVRLRGGERHGDVCPCRNRPTNEQQGRSRVSRNGLGNAPPSSHHPPFPCRASNWNARPSIAILALVTSTRDRGQSAPRSINLSRFIYCLQSVGLLAAGQLNIVPFPDRVRTDITRSRIAASRTTAPRPALHRTDRHQRPRVDGRQTPRRRRLRPFLPVDMSRVRRQRGSSPDKRVSQRCRSSASSRRARFASSALVDWWPSLPRSCSLRSDVSPIFVRGWSSSAFWLLRRHDVTCYLDFPSRYCPEGFFYQNLPRAGLPVGHRLKPAAVRCLPLDRVARPFASLFSTNTPQPCGAFRRAEFLTRHLRQNVNVCRRSVAIPSLLS